MEIRSLAGLTQLVDRAETVATELRRLSVTEPDVQFPQVPLPPSLQSMEDWLTTVEECRRKPRLARSKQLLEGHGIDTASIPAAVLESCDAIGILLQNIAGFPTPIRAVTLSALGRALTKGIDDATAVVDQSSDAVDAIGDLERQAVDHPWLYKLAVESVAESPADAAQIVQQAEAILQHAIAADQHGVVVSPFEGLDEALAALWAFNEALAERSRRLAEESLPQSHNDLKGRDLQTAAGVLRQSLQRLEDEKQFLFQQMNALVSQLESVGRIYDIEATTVADLRARLPELREALDERRRALRRSLGKDVYQVVEALANGELPASAHVDDAQLGRALRKAIDSGYRIRLEVPRED